MSEIDARLKTVVTAGRAVSIPVRIAFSGGTGQRWRVTGAASESGRYATLRDALAACESFVRKELADEAARVEKRAATCRANLERLATSEGLDVEERFARLAPLGHKDYPVVEYPVGQWESSHYKQMQAPLAWSQINFGEERCDAVGDTVEEVLGALEKDAAQSWRKQLEACEQRRENLRALLAALPAEGERQ